MTDDIVVTTSKDILTVLGTDAEPKVISSPLAIRWGSGSTRKRAIGKLLVDHRGGLGSDFHTPTRDKWNKAIQKLGIDLSSYLVKLVTPSSINSAQCQLSASVLFKQSFKRVLACRELLWPSTTAPKVLVAPSVREITGTASPLKAFKANDGIPGGMISKSSLKSGNLILSWLVCRPTHGKDQKPLPQELKVCSASSWPLWRSG